MSFPTMQKAEMDVHSPITTDWLYGVGNYSASFHGIYRGVVEYNRDPEQRGRVMVRVLEDGPEMQIENPNKPRVSTFELGWCEPLFIQGGGAQYGSFDVPSVGSRVFVMYLRSDKQNPVYFGGWFANPNTQRRYGVTKTTLEPPEGSNFASRPAPYWDHWMEEQGNEKPLEASEMLDDQPDVHFLMKSLKGNSLFWNERDYAEELTLVDRQGAELRFESATSGLHRRGRSTATQHESLKRDNLVFGSKVTLFDAIKQGLDIETNVFNDDSVLLYQHTESEYERIPELFSTRLAVELNRGEDVLKIVYKEDSTVVGEITFDAISKTIKIEGIDSVTIESGMDITLSAPVVRINGDLDVDGEIRSIQSKASFIGSDFEPYGQPTRNVWTESSSGSDRDSLFEEFQISDLEPAATFTDSNNIGVD